MATTFHNTSKVEMSRNEEAIKKSKNVKQPAKLKNPIIKDENENYEQNQQNCNKIHKTQRTAWKWKMRLTVSIFRKRNINDPLNTGNNITEINENYSQQPERRIKQIYSDQKGDIININ